MTATRGFRRSVVVSLLLLAVPAFVAAIPPVSRASAGTSVVVASSGVPAAGNEGTASVAVVLSPFDTLNEFDVEVSFDADMLAIEDADAVMLNPRWEPPAGLPLLIDVSSPGSMRVHATTGDACPPGIACQLFSFDWVALAEGTTTLSVSAFSLSGSQSGIAGALSEVTSLSASVTVGQAATPSPTATATASPTPTSAPTSSPTAATPTATTTAVTATAAATATATPTEVAGAVAPESGTGLASSDSAWIGQATIAAFIVAAMLAFGWIMSMLREPAIVHAAAAPPASPPAGRSPRARDDLQFEAVSQYLRMMEALGLASADIVTERESDEDSSKQG